MRAIRMTFWCVCLLVLAACTEQYTQNPTILQAESVLFTHPDSAYQLLKSIPSPEQLPEADYAAWCLHYTHAQYKLYMDIKSDKLIRVAVNYYSKTKLKKYSGTSYYVLGGVLEILHRKEKALLAYKNAIVNLEGTKEYDILGLSSINMGYIYKEDENYVQANNCIRKSIDLFNHKREKRFLASAYRELSNMCLQLESPFDTVMHYSNKALKIAKEINDSTLIYGIISRQGELLSDVDKRISISDLLFVFQHSDQSKVRNAAFLAYSYSGINKFDSASYYLKIADKEKGDKELEILKNMAGATVYENSKDFKRAYYFLEKAFLIQDTIFRNKVKSQMYRIDKQFDLSEKEKENARLKILNRNKVIFIALLIIVILALVILGITVRNRHKRKQLEQQTLHALEKQRLLAEIETKKLRNQQKRELLLVKLQSRIENTLRFNQLKMGILEQDKHDVFVAEITKQAVIAEKEWAYYIGEVNELYDGKITQLSERVAGLTPSDLIVIALICLHIDITDCCSLLSMTMNTMYVRRKRIKKRLELDTAITLDNWLWDNVAQYAADETLPEELMD